MNLRSRPTLDGRAGHRSIFRHGPAWEGSLSKWPPNLARSSRHKARGVHASPLLPSQENHRPPMYNHLKPDATTSSLADFLTDDFIEVVPISAPQVETSIKTVAVLPPLQVTFPKVLTDNASPKVSLDLIMEKPLPTADWYYNPTRTRF